MIYEFKQKLRRSALGNRFAQQLEHSFIFPFLYNTLFRLGLDESTHTAGKTAKDAQAYFSTQQEKIQQILDALADDTSKQIYQELLQCRQRHQLPRSGSPKDQYFLEGIIQLSKEEVFVDCGAFTGDTIESFLKATHNHYKKIVAFEPDPYNFAILKKQNIARCICFNSGVWDKKGSLSLLINGTGSTFNASQYASADKLQQVTVPVEALDQCPDCADMTYLKMDIEGAELPALKGAEQTIRKQHPKLGICIYHSNQDFVEIPYWILSLQLGYKLYVRHHGRYGLTETVLYAV